MLPTDAKILVVDDMKMIRTALKKYLGMLGYNNIVEAENGLDALIKYENEKPRFIFMDVVMPKTTGSEALKAIRAKDKAIPIAMLSSVADESLIAECHAQGIVGYVLKPLTMENGPAILSDILAKA
ncbi:MAG: response regulator [Gammaproteobacteria bacterium]|nr:response regulator [Gammaproteobacteria bacterium]